MRADEAGRAGDQPAARLTDEFLLQLLVAAHAQPQAFQTWFVCAVNPAVAFRVSTTIGDHCSNSV